MTLCQSARRACLHWDVYMCNVHGLCFLGLGLASGPDQFGPAKQEGQRNGNENGNMRGLPSQCRTDETNLTCTLGWFCRAAPRRATPRHGMEAGKRPAHRSLGCSYVASCGRTQLPLCGRRAATRGLQCVFRGTGPHGPLTSCGAGSLWRRTRAGRQAGRQAGSSAFLVLTDFLILPAL